MVDALAKARRLVRPGGHVIDIHPTPDPATIDVVAGGRRVRAGLLSEANEGREYVEADRAIASAVARGWFIVEAERTFVFDRHASSVQELVEHIAERWGDDAWLDPVTIARATQAAREAGPAVTVMSEIVRVQRLRPGVLPD